MYKSMLNELCQKSGWGSPEYSCIKNGYDHAPIFQASVDVNGLTFVSPAAFKNSKSALNAAAEIAFSHFATFSLPIAETKKIKKQKVPTMGSSSNQEGALNKTGVCLPVLPEDNATKITPSEHPVNFISESNHADRSISEPNPNKSTGSYLLCNKVRVYTSVPNMVLPKGTVVLPIGDGLWTVVSYGSD